MLILRSADFKDIETNGAGRARTPRYEKNMVESRQTRRTRPQADEGAEVVLRRIHRLAPAKRR
jgi:hypothetical protein